MAHHDDAFSATASGVCPEDLEEFRLAWIAEVNARKIQNGNPSSQLNNTESQSQPPSPTGDNVSSETPTHSELSALALYRRGAQEEREGRLSESLKYYRKAIRIDYNVEENFRKIELHRIESTAKKTQTDTSRQADGSSGSEPEATPSRLYDSIDLVTRITQENPGFITKKAHADMDQEGRDESLDVALERMLIQDDVAHETDSDHYFVRLPAEIIVHILRWAIYADIGMVLNLSLVCKRMFLFVREQAIWKFMAQKTFSDGRYLTLDDLNSAYGGSWRDLWLTKPRVRTDGVYISRVNYVRAGFGETFNRPVHVVTYFRYIRFLQNSARFIFFTSTTEPPLIVRKLVPNAHIKGMMQGDWSWESDNSIILTWKDPARPHVFTCTLRIGQNVLGRQNKLHWGECIGYHCVNQLNKPVSAE